jgi:gas vesicle protein
MTVMNLKDLKNLDKDEILNMLGLETKSSTAGWVAGTLGTFGLGLLVGAGIALMLAPKPGRELRDDIRDRLRRAPDDLSEAVSSVTGRESSSGGSATKTY